MTFDQLLTSWNFARSQNMDLILFSTKHSWNKKDKDNLIQYKKLLGVQEDEGKIASPGILYYYKRIPAIVLVN